MPVTKVKLSEWWPYITQPYDENWGYILGASGVLWTEARQKALIAKYEAGETKYKQGALYGKKWIGHYVIDCSGVAYRAFKKFGISIPHGSNSLWRGSYLSKKGKLSDKSPAFLATLPKGAPIFTGTESDKPHVGHYDGEGYVYEASGTIAGNIKTPITDKKWTYWGIYKNLDYDEATPSEPIEITPAKETPTDSRPTLRKGDKGEYVTLLQTKLLNLRYALPKFGADGDFGKETEAAVKQFQKDWGLKVDGIVGPETWKMLDSSPEVTPKKLYTVTIPHLSQSEAEAVLKQYSGTMTLED